jgi:small subunit ribosomal protein S6
MEEEKKVKESHYEVLFIISNKFTEDEAQSASQKVGKMITDKGGTVTYEEYWGKKKLAYPIKHFNHGYYFLTEFDMSNDMTQSFDREMKLNNDIIRHQVITQIKRTAEEIKKEKQKAHDLFNKKPETPEKLQNKDETKIDLKDLDQKLDQILDANDLL